MPQNYKKEQDSIKAKSFDFNAVHLLLKRLN